MSPLSLGRIAERTGDPRRGEIERQHPVGIKARHAFKAIAQLVRPPPRASSTQLRNARFDLGGGNRREEQHVSALVKPGGRFWRNSPLAGGKGAQNVGIEQPSGQKSASRKGDGSRSISTA